VDIEEPPMVRRFRDFRWDAVAHQPYKQDGDAPFKDISRQVLSTMMRWRVSSGISKWPPEDFQRWNGTSTRTPL
jgi:hypothetical protein